MTLRYEDPRFFQYGSKICPNCKQKYNMHGVMRNGEDIILICMYGGKGKGMTQTEYLQEFEEMCDGMLYTTKAKNTDYAGGNNNAFTNFQQIEHLTGGKISVEIGILVRMTDKMSRVTNLLSNEAMVKEESLDDTLKDLAVYATILRIYRRNKLNEQSK